MKRTVLLLTLAVALAACGNNRAEDRILFDGVDFRMKARTIDRNDLAGFTVEVRPVSASLEGARAAGEYEGIRYCIENYGNSRIKWETGPETDPETLAIENDTLVFKGRCDP